MYRKRYLYLTDVKKDYQRNTANVQCACISKPVADTLQNNFHPLFIAKLSLFGRIINLHFFNIKATNNKTVVAIFINVINSPAKKHDQFVTETRQ